MFVVVKECGFGYDSAKMKAIFKYSYPFLLTAIAGVLLSNLDRIILRAFFSLTEVGLYALAFKFGTLIQELVIEPFTRSFGAYRFKIMYEKNAKGILLKIYDQFLLILVFAGLGLSLFSRDVIRIMTASSYWEAYRVVPLLALSFIVQGIGYMFQTGILYEKKTRFLIHINLLSAAFNVCFYLLLIPPLGIVGAAMSVLCKSIVEATLTYIVSHRCYPMQYELFKTVKTLGLAAVFVVALRLFYAVPIWAGFLISVALVVSFPFALYQTGGLDKEEVLQYKSMAAQLWTRVNALRTGG
jgi:O-antigen/teichoic acid export membrane protein